MAKIRVFKETDYTVLDNGIFRDKNLSLKARGLLVTMLSLPEKWNYTIEGLSVILKDGKDSIRSTLKELEEVGYLVRNRIRNDKGQLTETEYIVYEKSVKNPENKGFQPKSGNPMLDNPIQLNKYNNKINNLYSATGSHDRDILEKVSSITNDMAINRAIGYYLAKYECEMGIKHPNVTYSAIINIVDTIISVLSDVYDDLIADNGLIKMIDRHFDTNYGQNIDYRLNHFGTEGIIKCQAVNCGYIDGKEMQFL